MRAPYGLEIIENCVTCPNRKDWLFSNLPPAAVQRLATITSATSYPKEGRYLWKGRLRAASSSSAPDV